MNTGIIIIIIAAVTLCAIGSCAVRARRTQIKKMQEDISLGDDVKTISGIYGTVVSFTENEITIESGSKGSEIVVARDAVASVSRNNHYYEKKGIQ